MKHLIFLWFCLFLSATNAQPIYNCRDGMVSFYSETPLENIDAVSNSMNVVLNTTTGDVVLIVAYTSFKFKKALMQEHFNEKYMESDKFPNATFKGKINANIFTGRDTSTIVTATGMFNCHGVEKARSDSATISVRDGKINIKGSFNVALKDHHIEVPKVVIQNVAEIINVTFDATLIPYKK